MRQTTEKAIVNRIRNMIKNHGGYCVKYHGGPFTQAGTPDLLGCLNGRAFAIEVKRPGGKATPLQLHELSQWAAAGAVAGVATSVEEAEGLLDITREVVR